MVENTPNTPNTPYDDPPIITTQTTIGPLR